MLNSTEIFFVIYFFTFNFNNFFYIQNAKNNGVTREEIVSAITHTTFYAGWPKAWATFNLAKDVWNENTPALSSKDKYAQTIIFPIGQPNDAFSKYFTGQSYIYPVSTK